MAKKKKGTRAGASKKAKKRAAPRPRKPAPKPKARLVEVHPGLMDPNKVDLQYLKKDIRDHIERLKGMDQTDKRVTDAMQILDQASASLRSGCAPTMVSP